MMNLLAQSISFQAVYTIFLCLNSERNGTCFSHTLELFFVEEKIAKNTQKLGNIDNFLQILSMFCSAESALCISLSENITQVNSDDVVV